VTATGLKEQSTRGEPARRAWIFLFTENSAFATRATPICSRDFLISTGFSPVTEVAVSRETV
jgi:hypothetical protein